MLLLQKKVIIRDKDNAERPYCDQSNSTINSEQRSEVRGQKAEDKGLISILPIKK